MDSHPAERPLRSFGRRMARRPRGHKRNLIVTLLPEISLTLPDGERALDPVNWFQDKKEIWLEIGFGAGEHLAAQAARNPGVGFIGCEPFINGVAKLLEEIEEKSLRNVRIFNDDARFLIARLPRASVDRVFLLFPDPWPKKRHHKRRLVNAEMLALLAAILKKGGALRLATDHEEYAAWMLQHVLACEAFEWAAERPSDWKSPPADWAPTRYEEKRVSGGAPVYFDFIRR